MSTYRLTDDPADQRAFFRSDRVFKEGEQFFFSTREQTIEGPYNSMVELNEALTLYVACCKEGFVGDRLTLANCNNAAEAKFNLSIL